MGAVYPRFANWETSNLTPVDGRHHIKLRSPLTTLGTQLEPPEGWASISGVSYPAMAYSGVLF